jgi:FKBP12-rapamycin complex-associated protein
MGALWAFDEESVADESSVRSFFIPFVGARSETRTVPTYDLTVPGVTSFCANGLVAHNCFEVAMHREKYPEKVPFRLTRMLVNAMEVSGIEGNFRSTCESVMQVLRENKESLMAVLEAFVYDPLINWRLLTPNGPDKAADKTGNASESESGSDEEADPEKGETAKAAKGGAVGAANADEAEGTGEQLNERAITVIARISNKLTGRDYNPDEELKTNTQVDFLIRQAMSQENLAQAYVGWCAFW